MHARIFSINIQGRASTQACTLSRNVCACAQVIFCARDICAHTYAIFCACDACEILTQSSMHVILQASLLVLLHVFVYMNRITRVSVHMPTQVSVIEVDVPCVCSLCMFAILSNGDNH